MEQFNSRMQVLEGSGLLNCQSNYSECQASFRSNIYSDAGSRIEFYQEKWEQQDEYGLPITEDTPVRQMEKLEQVGENSFKQEISGKRSLKFSVSCSSSVELGSKRKMSEEFLTSQNQKMGYQLQVPTGG